MFVFARVSADTGIAVVCRTNRRKIVTIVDGNLSFILQVFYVLFVLAVRLVLLVAKACHEFRVEVFL